MAFNITERNSSKLQTSRHRPSSSNDSDQASGHGGTGRGGEVLSDLERLDLLQKDPDEPGFADGPPHTIPSTPPRSHGYQASNWRGTLRQTPSLGRGNPSPQARSHITRKDMRNLHEFGMKASSSPNQNPGSSSLLSSYSSPPQRRNILEYFRSPEKVNYRIIQTSRAIVAEKNRRWPSPPFGTEVETIDVTALRYEAANLTKAKITDFEVVGSFNLIGQEKKKMVVPGSPAVWNPPKNTKDKLPKDTGEYLKDMSSAYFPLAPMEPMARCILSMRPDILSTSPPDIVACGSTFGNLLRVALGSHDTFRMLAQVKGGTLFLTRRDNSPFVKILDIRGYGKSILTHWTRWERDLGNSLSHQRVIKYHFGGFTVYLKYECDAYVPEEPKPKGEEYKKTDKAETEKSPKSPDTKNEKAHEPKDNKTPLDPKGKDFIPLTTDSTQAAQPIPGTPPPETSTKTPVIDHVTALLAAGSFREPIEVPPSEYPRDILVELSGTLVPQSSTLDIKTRSRSRRFLDIKRILNQELPRLWARQIPKLLVGGHEDGVFKQVEHVEVGQERRVWEMRYVDNLARFAQLLEIVRERVGGMEGGKAELVAERGVSELKIREQVGEGHETFLPETWEMWDAKKGEIVREGERK